jgi:hypothetical protein
VLVAAAVAIERTCPRGRRASARRATGLVTMRKGIGEHSRTRVPQAGTRELQLPILGRLLYQVNNFDELLASWARYDVRSLPPRRTLAEHRAPCRERTRSARTRT